MKKHPREFQLDYLNEYELGKSLTSAKRRVPLQIGRVENLRERTEYFRNNVFGWKLARQLEGRADLEDGIGIWPINCWRCERRFGMPGSDVFPQEMTLQVATPEIHAAARNMRMLGYVRAANSTEAQALIAAGREVRYACEITSDWYDPPDGIIKVLDEAPTIFGSHAVPLIKFDNPNRRQFIFPNSWGEEWGHEGWGAISEDYFDRFIIEAWVGFGLGLFVPYMATSGIICLEWKWSLNDAFAVHAREIVDAGTSERLGWAFCIKREGFLDIEEFFVWPSERIKGYGEVLANMVRTLAGSVNMPLRMLVSYADTEPENQSNLEAAAKLLGLQLAESDARWVHLIGTTTPTVVQRSVPRPLRPANMLERLRPKDEAPIEAPIDYSVFFGTSRAPLDPDSLDKGFGTERGQVLHTGVSKVTIPRTHRFGGNGKSWIKFWHWLTGENPKVLENRVFADEASFEHAISPLIKAFGDETHNLLYVHGFRVGFEGAILQAAQFGVDLKIPGATFVFSWPSAGTLGSYMADESAVEACIPFFEEFVGRVLRVTDNAPLSIIVHSMGNRAVLRFLESVAREQSTEAHGRIRNVIFAAPDVDTDVFKKTVHQIVTVPARTTLYATRADIALATSGWLHSYHRAGLAPPVVIVPGMDTVVVEGFNLLNLGHGYYADSASVLHDIFVLIRYNAEPSGRAGLTRAETSEGAPFWKLTV